MGASCMVYITTTTMTHRIGGVHPELDTTIAEGFLLEPDRNFAFLYFSHTKYYIINSLHFIQY